MLLLSPPIFDKDDGTMLYHSAAMWCHAARVINRNRDIPLRAPCLHWRSGMQPQANRARNIRSSEQYDHRPLVV